MNEKCPNCESSNCQMPTILNFNDNVKMIQCGDCGTRFNVGDTKEDAEIPEDVNTPEKLASYKQKALEAEIKLRKILIDLKLQIDAHK